MKHQYFADRRDFYKYELLLDFAKEYHSPEFLSVLMLTPNDDTGEGGIEGYEAGHRRQDLFSFLKGCLARGTRDVSLLRRFMEQAGVKYRPFHDDRYFDDSLRPGYFADCAAAARDYPLIFFDPDIGLQAGTRSYMRQKGAEKYLMYSDVSTVTRAAAQESVVVVYQHLQRDKTCVRGDLDTRCRGLCGAVGSSFATFLTDLEVAFLVAGCSEESNTWAREVVASHGEKHDLQFGEVARESEFDTSDRQTGKVRRSRRPRPNSDTSARVGSTRESDSGEGTMQVCRHRVSNRNGRQVMVAGLKLRDLGYRRGAQVEVSDPSEDPANKLWRYVVSNDEHATMVSRDSSPPEWIQPGVLVEIKVLEASWHHRGIGRSNRAAY